MKASLIDKIQRQPRDFLFVMLILVCIMLAVGGIHSSLATRASHMMHGGARPVDAAAIKKQILDGNLSPHKALYYRKIPR